MNNIILNNYEYFVLSFIIKLINYSKIWLNKIKSTFCDHIKIIPFIHLKFSALDTIWF